MSERIPVTDFEVWLRTTCFRMPPADCHDLAESAWLHQQERIAELEKVIADCNGCIQAAQIEGLTEVLAETTDERLKDLVERRLLWVENYCAGYLKEQGE